MSGTVMITTGGTGGHVFPGLAVAAELVARGWGVFWLGTREGMEAKLVPQHGVDFEAISFRGVRGKGWKTLLLGPCVLAALDSLRGAPAAAERCGLRRLRRSLGALMGVARAAAGDPRLERSGLNRVAYGPIASCWVSRRDAGRDRRANGRQSAARRHRGTPCRSALRRPHSGRCGSWSSAAARRPALNETCGKSAPPCRARPIVHQAGAKHIDALARAYRDAGVEAECVAFIDDMASRYAWADFAIARGGALTVSELAAVGLGALIVPLPGAIADEQTANADFLVRAGGAIRIAQDELDAGRLASLLSSLDRPKALAMATAARAVGRTDATDRVADACLEAAERKP
jgi:UDP-N-acetylglucosamine--N-acetylmuramyl-(pentapeptide) pyrophosphoryl-undecaprenol N-acetylglucosamine transferase